MTYNRKYKELLKVNNKKTNNPPNQNRQFVEYTFPKRRNMNGKQAHFKKLKNHQSLRKCRLKPERATTTVQLERLKLKIKTQRQYPALTRMRSDCNSHA